eukprot:jgi/Ulvmu1/10732/UM068_0020.1
MASADSWTTIESDPGVFTELLERIGVKNAEVQELYELGGEQLKELEPVYGLIFLFKFKSSLYTAQATEQTDQVYFAKQIINNACATQAMLSILLNADENEVEIGDQLRNLREFTADFPPDMRGVAIGNAEGVRQAHNSFAPPEAQLSDPESRKATDSDELYHFVSYVHKAGALWELDGLQEGPIKCCECAKEEWLARASEVINTRISTYTSQEIRFNLMAIVRDARTALRGRTAALQRRLEEGGGDVDDTVRGEILREKAAVEDALAVRERERERWRTENARRKHNYVPLIFNLLQAMAERDELLPLVQKAAAGHGKGGLGPGGA